MFLLSDVKPLKCSEEYYRQLIKVRTSRLGLEVQRLKVLALKESRMGSIVAKTKATVPAGQEQVGQSSNDADSGVGPDLLERVVERPWSNIVDHLRSLHSFAGSNVQSGHISPNVTITDDGKQRSHFNGTTQALACMLMFEIKDYTRGDENG